MKSKNKFPKIDYDQYLSEILDHVPNKVIFFKVIAGVGVY